MRLLVKVVPGASREEIAGWLGEALKVRVTAAPERGRANDAVRALLAEVLGVTPDRIRVIAGHGSPRKMVEVEGLEEAEARRRIASALSG